MYAVVIAALLVGAQMPARAQHEGHGGTPKQTTPKRTTTRARPAPKKTTRRKAPAATSRRRASGTRRNASTNNQNQPAMPPAMDHSGHEGHQTGQPTPTPVPAPTPMPPGHTHQQPPPAQPSPTPQQQPTVQPTPAATPGDVHAGHQMTNTQPTAAAAENLQQETGPVLRLEDLERMAAERNPTLAQAEAAIRAAEGRRRQAGAFPNPIIGYFGEELSFRAAGETSEHGVFVEQTIPLGGKLGKSRRIFASERDQAKAIAEAQRQRVLNSVRVLYYDALGAQRLLEVRTRLARLASEAVGITKELYNVGQADRPDQLEIEIEAERAEIDRLRAENDREQVWRLLGAMVNNPELRPMRLEGNLEDALTTLDEEQARSTLLSDSPEVRVARAGVERARAVVARARAERIPDLFVRGGVAYNNERLERDNRKIGAEGQIEVGVNVPIFNRNKGGIAAAEAELAISERELERLQLVLRTRLASSFREYRNSQQMVERYRTRVVPRARQAYEMYLSNFRQMAASYPQVLIAQRTLFQVEAEYARALVSLRRSVVGLRGFLLGGGLDAVGRPNDPGEGTEGFTLRSASEASGDSDNR
jgi:cobalt-zinc-cadmium efflux system outer membrane protein